MKTFANISEIPKDFTGICFTDSVKQIRHYLNGKLHNPDGPAVISIDLKNKWYYVNDIQHRLDGPAVILGPKVKYFHINGTELNEEDFNKHSLVIAHKHKMKQAKEEVLHIKLASEIPKDYTGTVMYPSGMQKRLHKGTVHCFNEPAIIYPSGKKQWWIDGIEVTNDKALVSLLETKPNINFIESSANTNVCYKDMKDGWNYYSNDGAFTFIKDGKPFNPDNNPAQYDVSSGEFYWDETSQEFLEKDEFKNSLKIKEFATAKGLSWFQKESQLPKNFSGTAMVGDFEVILQNGKRHCETGPACIEYDENLNIKESHYFLNGTSYASKKTWEIKLAKLKKEKEVTEALSSPLVQLRALAHRLATANEPILTKDDKIPTDGRSIWIDEQNKKVIVKSFVRGIYHSLTEAAYIEYSPDGSVIDEQYSVNGIYYKTGSEWLEAVEAYNKAEQERKLNINIGVKIPNIKTFEELAKETFARNTEVKKPSVVKSDLTQASKRVAAKQFLKLTKSYVVKLLSKGNNKAEANLDKFFETDQGLIMLNGMLAVVLPVMEAVIPENWKGLYKEICKEYRVEALASSGDLLLNAVFANSLSELKEESEEVFEKLRIELQPEESTAEDKFEEVPSAVSPNMNNLSIN